MSNYTYRVAAFLAPFLFVHAINLFFIPGSYFLARTDAPMFLLGTGLNWLMLDPLLVWHLPGYTLMQVSGIILLLSGLPIENLNTFQLYGMGFQWIVLVLAGLYAAYLGGPLRLNGRQMFLLGCLSASMPTALAYSTIWGANYPLCALTVPAGLGIYTVLTRDRNTMGTAGGTLALIGFLLANSYAAWTIAAAYACGLIMLRERSPMALAQRFGVPSDRHVGYSLLLIPLIGLFTAGLAPVPLRLIMVAPLFALGAGIAFWLIYRGPLLRVWGYGFCLPLLAGWFVGANYSSLHWRTGFTTAVLAATGLPLSEWLLQVDLMAFFRVHVWNLLLLAPLAGIGLLLRRRIRSSAPHRSILVFSAAGVALTLLTSAELSMVFPEGRNLSIGDFGISRERYYLFTPVFLSVLMLYSWHAWGRKALFIAAAAVVGISVLSLADYVRDKSLYVSHVIKVKREMDSRIDGYLKERPDGLVIFVRVEYPDRAAVLYGYHNYRGEDFTSPLSFLTDPRIRYAVPDLPRIAKRVREGGIPPQVLIVHASRETLSCMSLVWYDETLDVGISTAAGCRTATL